MSLDVREFGAKGDDAADDWMAIQSAIDALSSQGGVVFVPRGVYRLSRPVTIRTSHVSLHGEQRTWNVDLGGTRLKAMFSNLPILQVAGVSPTQQLQMNTVRDLDIGRDGTTDTAGAGIEITDAVRPTISDVNIQNCFQGVYARGAINLLIERTDISRLLAMPAGNSYGVFLDPTAGNFSSTIRQTRIQFPNPWVAGMGYGVYAMGAANLTDLFLDGVEVSWAHFGIWLQYTGVGSLNSQDIHLTRCIVDSFRQEGIRLHGFDRNATISILGGWTAPDAVGTTTYGIRAVQSSGLSLVGHQGYGTFNTPHHIAVSLETVRDSTVSANLIRNAGNGIVVNNSSTISVMGNSVANDPTHPGSQGLLLQTAHDTTIIGNVISGAITNGILVDATSTNTISLGNHVVPGG